MLEYDDVELGVVFALKERKKYFYVFDRKDVGRYRYIQITYHSKDEVYLTHEYVDKDDWYYKASNGVYDNVYVYLESVKINSLILRKVIKFTFGEEE